MIEIESTYVSIFLSSDLFAFLILTLSATKRKDQVSS